MSFDYSKHRIYASIGYLVVMASYMEDCIEEAHSRICDKSNSKQPVTVKLAEIEDVVGSQPNATAFMINETNAFFEARNKLIHGQLYGSSINSSITITHNRSGVTKEPFAETVIDGLINDAQNLLDCWQSIRLSKLVQK